MKQEFTDSQTGEINGKKVVCRVLDQNTKVSACRKCCFDHEKMIETCDTVNCVPNERADKLYTYFELVK